MRLIIILLILISNNCCAWSSAFNYQRSKHRYEEKKFEATILNQQLLGVNQNSVKEALGNPTEKRKENFLYLADSNCTGLKCTKKWADEVWFYEFIYKDQSGRYIYSINVYFVEGKVVQVY